MEKFEEYLLTEFNEQHNNIREIENSTTNRVQFLFTLEGILVGGVLSLLGTNIVSEKFFALLFFPFWLIFSFGHTVYLSAIVAVKNMIVLDFSNTLVRLYFSQKSKKESKYMLFLPKPDSLLKRKGKKWENHNDNSIYLAKFTGFINATNLVIALLTSVYSLFYLLNEKILDGVSFSHIVMIVIILLEIFAVWFYNRIFFIRIIRKQEQETLLEQNNILKAILRKD